jgi:16S rRNA (guanine(966)-N(2))-methyltransferase RsmD
MKIGSGRFRGRSIQVPKGLKTRPTSGRLKKALFDIIAPELPGARVLDLFAGAGALGLEAISRGASHVIFVERRKSAVAVIAANLEKLGVADQAEVIQNEAAKAIHHLSQRSEELQVVLIDPPYGAGAYQAVVEHIDEASIVDSGGIVIVEHHHKAELDDAYGSLRKHRVVRAGESCLTFYRLEE